jgi:hypothetical protein
MRPDIFSIRGPLANTVGIIALIFVFGAYLWPFIKPTPKWPGIPPVENANGTVDFTIRTPKEISPSKRDLLWVIRLPKKAYVDDNWNSEPSTITTEDGVSMSFGAARRNSTLVFFFDAENSSISETLPGKQDNSLIFTSLQNDFFTQANFDDLSSKNSKSFRYRDCVQSAGLWQNTTIFYSKTYKDNPASNTKAVSDEEHLCQRFTPDDPIFEVTDGSGQIVIVGDCFGLTCSAVVRLNFNREVRISFNRSQMGEILLLHSLLSDFIIKHTIRVDQ